MGLREVVCRVTFRLLLLQALSSQPKQSHVSDLGKNGYLRKRVESGLEMKYLVPLRGKERGRAWREAPSAGQEIRASQRVVCVLAAGKEHPLGSGWPVDLEPQR